MATAPEMVYIWVDWGACSREADGERRIHDIICSPNRKMSHKGRKNSGFHQGKMRQNKVHIHSLVIEI